MARAFSGLRVLDLSRLLPGPFCSLLLADLGADVIKIEEPGRGDYARQTTPLVGEAGVGATFLLLNRNKRSLSVDLKQEAGKAVFRDIHCERGGVSGGGRVCDMKAPARRRRAGAWCSWCRRDVHSVDTTSLMAARAADWSTIFFPVA